MTKLEELAEQYALHHAGIGMHPLASKYLFEQFTRAYIIGVVVGRYYAGIGEDV
jgi:hypothetical protein